MSILPSLTATDIVRALHQAGFIDDRQKGSHLVLLHPLTRARTVVPIHGGRTLKRHLVYSIIRDAQLTTEEFIELL